MSECDFCSEPITNDNGEQATVYPASDIIDTQYKIAFRGGWLACSKCASFIKQYDSGKDDKARDNLARRSLEKYRRKYGLHINGFENKGISAVLLVEIRQLHDKFWASRTGEPVPYESRLLEK